MPKSASSEVQAEFKEQAATLKEVVKAQLLRLENMMVRQYRWPVARWKEMFLLNPVLVPFAVRLIWGHYDEKGKRLATFHALEDLSLTDAHDEPIELGDSGGIGIIHPLELDPEELAIWKNHVADYEIDSPFLQLERPTVRVKPEEEKVKIWKELNGTNLNAMTFRGRAERINWARGSVCDGGGVTSYYKSFPRAGVDVFLGVDGMYIGIGMDEEVKLTDVTFVKGGSVKIGTYEYDEPSQENDTRLIPFGEVPVIVFSEAMGDLQKIAGSKATTTEEAE